ncbi:MAG TPA: baseplate J/gp47 family protein [Ktedonobacteraceae bacterium]|nr:baseplate J/gp47 family protein [Ktedonobacteraceae bacterium]
MPLKIPPLDTRTYQEILSEVLARIPAHTAEWTNFNESDPGVTLLELFVFLNENLLYRSNLIPEINRHKFLSLLGISLQAASSARGLVTFSNARGPLQTITLQDKLEVRAGQVPFRTEKGLDVLPVETQIYYKRKALDPGGANTAYFHQLYQFHTNRAADFTPLLYETTQLLPNDKAGVDLSQVTDNSLWIALLARSTDKPASTQTWSAKLDEVRHTIAGKTISLGIVPFISDASRRLLPRAQANAGPPLLYRIPHPSSNGAGPLPGDSQVLAPQYLPLDANAPTDVLTEPGVVEITLPGDYRQLRTWDISDPFEMSIQDFPPSLEDTQVNNRLITWLRISAPNTLPDATSITSLETPSSLQVKLLWLGINTVFVTQQSNVINELLPTGTGEPDQIVTLAKTPVIDHTVSLTVTVNGIAEQWQEIGDLLDAGSEVTKSDPRYPPGTQVGQQKPDKVFTVNCESGEIRFGDGLHGKRLPYGATVRANYAYGLGTDGNVEAGAISTSAALPPGLKVINPLRTWGGARAETIDEAEKQSARYLQHRDRLVTASDFESITLRTPGVDIGRVEVIASYNPDLALIVPEAPGAVTVMVIPNYDPDHPDAPVPDRIFLDTIADYLDVRRLITTEVFVRGPVYKPVWVSIGIQVVPGYSIAQVREGVKSALAQFLSPLPDPNTPGAMLDDLVALLTSPQQGKALRGWPLLKPVRAQELLAVASRVEGILLITQVLIAEGSSPPTDLIEMNGLELPHLAGMFVSLGDPLDIDQVRGQGGPLLLPGTPTIPGTGPSPAPGSLAQPQTPGFMPSPGQGIAPVQGARPVQAPKGSGSGGAPPQPGQQQSPFAPAAPPAPPAPPKECM